MTLKDRTPNAIAQLIVDELRVVTRPLQKGRRAAKAEKGPAFRLNGGPSLMSPFGPKRTSRHVCFYAAIGGQADISERWPNCGGL